jgi:hypothetical protein
MSGGSRALPPLALLRPDHPASLHHEQREITGTRALRRAREHEPESGEQHREHDASLWPGGGPAPRSFPELKPGTQRVSTRPAPEARACVRRTPRLLGRVFSRSSCGRGSVPDAAPALQPSDTSSGDADRCRRFCRISPVLIHLCRPVSGAGARARTRGVASFPTRCRGDRPEGAHDKFVAIHMYTDDFV